MNYQTDYYKAYKKYKAKYKSLQFGGITKEKDCTFKGCWKCEACGSWNVPLATSCSNCGVDWCARGCKGKRGCYRKK